MMLCGLFLQRTKLQRVYTVSYDLWESLSSACRVRASCFMALQIVNLNLSTTRDHHFHQLHELEELRDHAYAHSYRYKHRTKELHDRKLRGDKQFKCGDMVLLFNSRLKLFPGKLKSRWYGPYTVKEVLLYGTVKIEDKNGSFKVNGHRLKHYIGEKASMEEGEVLCLTASLG
ncbi:uncharacterized protein LOC143615651 [Bidens hawaiensis]|uniref:uncharacterized protein LOC143615651 n=1 Tax=Bidens hawaiensis TaxID=980011 RepID=UPI00404B6B28